MRSLLATALLAIGLAACGGSSGTPVTEPAPAPQPETVAAAPPAEAPASQAGDCTELYKALETVAFHLQIGGQLFDDAQYEALTSPESIVDLDPDGLDSAIDRLAALPDTDAAVASVHEIAGLLRTNITSGAPFSDGSGNGQRLLDAVGQRFVADQVELSQAYEAHGCRPS